MPIIETVIIRTREIRDYFSRLQTADRLAIYGIVITLVFGGMGLWMGKEQIRLANAQIELSKEQDKTSVSIDTFKSLLLKTDRLITLQVQQLRAVDSELNALKSLVGNTEKTIGISTAQSGILSKQLGISNSQYLQEGKRHEHEKYIDLNLLHFFSVEMLGVTYPYRSNPKTNNISRPVNKLDRELELNKVYDLLCDVKVNKELFKNVRLSNSWRKCFTDASILRLTYHLQLVDETKRKDEAAFESIMQVAAQLSVDANVYSKMELELMEKNYDRAMQSK